MKMKITALGYGIIGHPSKFAIERQFLNLIMFLFSLMCFFASIVNVSIGLLPLSTIIISFTMVLFAFCYYLARIKGSIAIPLCVFFIFAIFVIPITGWITNGGNSGSFPYMLSPFIFAIWMVFHDKLRIAALVTYSIVIFSLFFINFQYPEWIVGYDSRLDRFVDTSFTAFISMLASALCIALIMSAYNAKQAQLQEAHKKELAHTEKLVTLGTLVSEVAHEVNNPNNSLMLDIESMRKIMEEIVPIIDDHTQARPDFEIRGFPYDELKKEIKAMTDRMKRNSERIKRIVSDLRLFAKNEVPMSENVLINDVVRSAIMVIDHIIKKYTKNFHVICGENIPMIKGNIQYMEQVIINLIKNACQALSDFEKGVYVSIVFDKDRKNIVLTVRDEGKGMDADMLKNLFTPFITTKGKEGTGLGLSICNNIVKSHNGRIEVESKLSVGTTIRVILPVANTR